MGGPGGTQAFTQWQNLPPYGIGQPGSVQSGNTPEPFFRDHMDAVRSMWRRTPDAEYPDGYLGTISSRRDNRLDSMKARLNEKQYQRGVHKGERIDTGDYYWPDAFTPDMQLRAQMEEAIPFDAGALTPRFAPIGVVAPKITPERVFDQPGQGFTQQVQGTRRQAQLRKLAPAWRW